MNLKQVRGLIQCSWLLQYVVIYIISSYIPNDDERKLFTTVAAVGTTLFATLLRNRFWCCHNCHQSLPQPRRGRNLERCPYCGAKLNL